MSLIIFHLYFIPKHGKQTTNIYVYWKNKIKGYNINY